MVWNAIVAVAMATRFGRARAAPDITPAEREMFLNSFNPMFTYSGKWIDLFPFNRSYSSVIADGTPFTKYTGGGSVTFDFVGSHIAFYGYFGDRYHYGYFGENFGAVETNFSEVRMRIDNNDYTTYLNSGNYGSLPGVLIERALSVGAHTVELTSTRGVITFDRIWIRAAMPVSIDIRDDFADAQQVNYTLATKDPLGMNTGFTTTGNWAAQILPNVSEHWESRHIRTTEVGATFSMPLGRGNDYVELRGNIGRYVAFTVEIDPAPYLTPASVELQPSSEYIMPDRLLYYAPLERDKDYTLKVTNKGGDIVSADPPPLELTSVSVSKAGPGWVPSETSSNTSAESTDGDDGQGAAASDDNNNPSKSGINAGAVAGGVVGGLAAAIGIAIAIFVYLRRKRQRDREAAQANREKLDVDGDLDGDLDNVTPFMRHPHSPHQQAPADPHLATHPAGQTHGKHLSTDQPAPQTPQDTDAGPVPDMIPPSYDPNWAANVQSSTHAGYAHLAVQVDEQGGSSARPLQWPRDRKDRRG